VGAVERCWYQNSHEKMNQLVAPQAWLTT